MIYLQSPLKKCKFRTKSPLKKNVKHLINNALQRKIEQTLWDLEEDSCAIASFAVRTLCATVHHVFEDFESVVHEFMRLVAVNIHHHRPRICNRFSQEYDLDAILNLPGDNGRIDDSAIEALSDKEVKVFGL